MTSAAALSSHLSGGVTRSLYGHRDLGSPGRVRSPAASCLDPSRSGEGVVKPVTLLHRHHFQKPITPPPPSFHHARNRSESDSCHLLRKSDVAAATMCSIATKFHCTLPVDGECRAHGPTTVCSLEALTPLVHMNTIQQCTVSVGPMGRPLFALWKH